MRLRYNTPFRQRHNAGLNFIEVPWLQKEEGVALLQQCSCLPVPSGVTLQADQEVCRTSRLLKKLPLPAEEVRGEGVHIPLSICFLMSPSS